MRKVVVCLSLSLAAPWALSGYQSQAGVDGAVEVTFIASGRDGAPVEDLRADEVRLRDGGKQQKVLAFEKVAASAAGGGAEQAGKPGLHYVVLLDALNTNFSDAPAVREEMLRILGELALTNHVTLLFMRNGLFLLHDHLASGPSVLRKLAGEGVPSAGAASFTLEGREWVFGPETGLDQLFVPAGVLDRNRLTASLSYLRNIAVNMAKRPGRKNLIWISSSFPLLIGLDQTGLMEKTGDATGAPSGGGTGELRSRSLRIEDAGAAFLRDMEMMGRVINNANLSVYPVDARSLATGNSPLSDSGQLKDMAKFTGGVAYTGRTDVAKALQEAIADSKVSYVLTYQPSDLKPDGRFHPLKLETTRRDVKLRHREGYWAPVKTPR